MKLKFAAIVFAISLLCSCSSNQYCELVTLTPTPLDIEKYGDIIGKWESKDGEYVEFHEDGTYESDYFIREDDVLVDGKTKHIECEKGTYQIRTLHNGQFEINFNVDSEYWTSYGWYVYGIFDDTLYFGHAISATPIEDLIAEDNDSISFARAK